MFVGWFGGQQSRYKCGTFGLIDSRIIHGISGCTLIRDDDRLLLNDN